MLDNPAFAEGEAEKTRKGKMKKGRRTLEQKKQVASKL